jgi:hypothetical protein
VKVDENLRPGKTSPKKRIDGVVAAVTALWLLMVLQTTTASPYAARGVRSVGCSGLPSCSRRREMSAAVANHDALALVIDGVVDAQHVWVTVSDFHM